MKKSIRMLETKPGAEDGLHTIDYEKGKKYDLEPSLADVFLENKWAEPVQDLEEEPKEPNTPPGPDEVTGLLAEKPSTWIGAKLADPEGEEQEVESVSGSQVFFKGETEAVDYRIVRRDYKVLAAPEKTGDADPDKKEGEE